jgi:hypothetical protein
MSAKKKKNTRQNKNCPQAVDAKSTENHKYSGALVSASFRFPTKFLSCITMLYHVSL